MPAAASGALPAAATARLRGFGGEREQGGVADAAHDRQRHQRRSARAGLVLGARRHAQQLVGLSLRNSPAVIRSASLIVRYGAQVSARSSTVSPNLIA